MMKKYLDFFTYQDTWIGIGRLVALALSIYYTIHIISPADDIAEWLKLPLIIIICVVCFLLIFFDACENFKSVYRKWSQYYFNLEQFKNRDD